MKITKTHTWLRVGATGPSMKVPPARVPWYRLLQPARSGHADVHHGTAPDTYTHTYAPIVLIGPRVGGSR